jgi:hypothetical protein
MAFRYLIYSTGTTYAETIVRESATNNPGVNEASLFSNFVIPEIQPVFLWRVTGGTDVVPNTDSNISAYSQHIAPPPSPDDLVTYGQVTGITETKIDTVTGATGQVPIFTADGNIEDSGFSIAQLTGGTDLTFVGSGGTQVFEDGNTITIYSVVPSGTTVNWGDITGTLSNQTDLQNALNAKLDESVFTGYTASTEQWLEAIDEDIDYLSGVTSGLTTSKLDVSVFNTYTGNTQPILDAALTGVTNLGTGTTLGSTSGRNITLKSISVLGGLSLSGDADNLIISGQTGGAGTITGATRGLSVYGADIGLGGNIDTNTTITLNPSRSLTFKDTGTTFSTVIHSDGLYTLGNDAFGNSSIDIQPSVLTLNQNTVNNSCGTLITQTNLTISLCAYNIAGGDNAQLQICNNGRIIANGDSGFAGIEYLANYSPNFVARSLVDAAYVTGLTSGLSAQIANKLDISTFNIYTGATETRIGDLEDDVTELFNESLINITGATNGLSKSGSKDVKLGGTLTEDTVISGLTHDFTINVDNITLQSVGAINLIDANGVGGINIESDGGVVKIQGNDSTSTPVTKIEVGETTLLITDDRATPRGIQYADDYSGTFQNRSLVDKAYVDSVASGLIPKANVKAATTTVDGNIDLTGATFTGSIDGYTLLDGDRVLITQQTLASENGIYVYTLATNDFVRSDDFNGNPDGEVTDGNLIPVLYGTEYENTIWVLVTPNPIIVGTTPLTFTLFSSPLDLQAGVGIGITGQTIAVDGASLAGNSIVWTGNTFNVDITSGTLATALNSKLNASVFNSYTGTTETRLQGIETDISNLESDVTGLTATKLDVSVFNTYTGDTETRLSGIEDDIDYISGETDNRLLITDFNTYTGDTETRLSGIEDDIDYISGVTDTKLDTTIFTGYTASTSANEIFLVHTGGTNINTVAPTGIIWHSQTLSGSLYEWTGGTNIKVLETGSYEISYNIPFVINSNSNISIGGNVTLNGATTLNVTAAAGMANRTGAAGSVNLASAVVTLTANDIIVLSGFRTAQTGTATTQLSGSISIKKKNTLQ